MGWSDLSFQGSSYYQTPNIDRLRNEGVFFSNTYAAAANSAPSRASLMTGVYTPCHGVYTVAPADRGPASERKFISATNSSTPNPQYPILAQVLQENGYATYHIGKWHLGDNPLLQGFDVNIGGNMSGHPKSYFSPYNNPDLPDGEDGEYLTDRLTNETIKILETCKESPKPFFIYFATYAVHTPHQPKAELAAKYLELKGSEAHFNNKYAALIESMDTNVGYLLDYLEQSKLIENTIVIFISDNGGLYSCSRQWPLRAGKGSFYEGGIRTPMIISWKGVTKNNTSCDTPISQMDIYPTILKIADIPSQKLDLNGVDISPLFHGKDIVDRALYWHFPAYLEGGNQESTDAIFRSRPLSVIRDAEWKLIYNYETDIIELYNLKDDISESHNLAKQEAEKAKILYSKLQEWLAKYNAPTEFILNPQWAHFK